LSTHHVDSRCGNLLIDPFPISEIDEDVRAHCLSKVWYSDAVREKIRRADKVILASSWSPWVTNYMERSVLNIKKLAPADVLVVSGKRFSDPASKSFLEAVIGMSKTEKLAFNGAIHTEDAEAYLRMKSSNSIELIDLISLYCSGLDSCRQFDDNGLLLSFDQSHLTREGVAYFVSKLKDDRTWTKHFSESLGGGQNVRSMH